jgi:hypothetical protein
MKTAKCVFAAGFLLAVLAGCFNPITAVAPVDAVAPQAEAAAEGVRLEPFTVDIIIADDAVEARFLFGPSEAQLKTTGFYNVMQLVVLDEDRDIFAVAQARRQNSGDDLTRRLGAGSWVFGRDYHFLLLLGYWDREADADNGDYQYAEGNTPTLLAAGFLSQRLDKSGKVTIAMNPITVSTAEFAAGEDIAGLKKVDGLKYAQLPAGGDWEVTWTLGESAEAALDTLLAAKNLASGGTATVLFGAEDTAAAGKVEDAALQDDGPSVAGNAVTQPLKKAAAAGNGGKNGSVNFNLTYTPFSFAPADLANNAAFSGKTRKWIIRNGVNDDAQDANTDFSAPANWGTGGKNGNGAVNFTVVKSAGGGGGGSLDLDLADYIPAPVTNKAATQSITAPWCEGPVAWAPADKLTTGYFEPGVEYTATVTLSVQAAAIGYNGVTINPTGTTTGTMTVAIAFPGTQLIDYAKTMPFSNSNSAAETAKSVIDTLVDAKHQTETLELVLDWEAGTADPVKFGADTDLGTTGLVLEAGVSSPADLVIDGGGRVIDMVGAPGSAASPAPLITVKTGVTLTLKNITLMGLKANATIGEQNNNAPVIGVDGGNLILGEGAVICDNTATGGGGGGNGGHGFFGTGGSGGGGGVCVISGTLTLEADSVIRDNTGSGGAGNSSDGGGGAVAGGVLVIGGTVTMKAGAVISGNTGSGGMGGTFTSSTGVGYGGGGGGGGGGVLMAGGTLTLEAGADISGNTGSGGGGGSRASGGSGASQVLVGGGGVGAKGSKGGAGGAGGAGGGGAGVDSYGGSYGGGYGANPDFINNAY